MHSSKDDLIKVLNSMQGLPVLVVGDLILDRYIWGEVERISPEAPVPIVDVRRTEDRLGGAANVARNLRGVGCDVGMCGFIGDDEEGRLILSLLEGDGIRRDGVILDRTRPSCLKTRILAQRQQMVRVDREVRRPHSATLSEGFAAVVDAQLNAARAVILSDYGKGAITEILIRRLQEAKKAGRLSLGERPLVVDPHPANYDIYREISIAKPNRKEAETASGLRITDQASAIEAARRLIEKWSSEMLVVTLGEDGMVIVPKDDRPALTLETAAREVFDVSGAGDTVTALFAAAIAAGATPMVAGDLANLGAGIVVSEVGTVAITREKLLAELA